MKRNEVEKIMVWKKSVDPYLLKAKLYNETHQENYPMVYFAGIKNGRWGITLPAATGVNHSANDCPILYNNRDYATAWAMFVEHLLDMGEEKYVAWCRSMGYLVGTCQQTRTGMPYIRYDNTNISKNARYQLYIPTTGKGYSCVMRNEFDKNYYAVSAVVSKRNRLLEELLTSKEDDNGTLPEKRIAKYRKILMEGAFQETFLFPEEYIKKNCDLLVCMFAMAYTYADEHALQETFLFFKELFDNGDVNFSKLEKHQKRLGRFLEDIPHTTRVYEYVLKMSEMAKPKVVSKKNIVKKIETKVPVVEVTSQVSTVDLNALASVWGAKIRA